MNRLSCRPRELRRATGRGLAGASGLSDLLADSRIVRFNWTLYERRRALGTDIEDTGDGFRALHDGFRETKDVAVGAVEDDLDSGGHGIVSGHVCSGRGFR